MDFVVECSNCRAQYRADETLAGRKVRCRHCGTVLSVSSANAQTMEVNFSALEALDASESGLPKVTFGERTSSMARPAEVDPLDLAAPPDFDRVRTNRAFRFLMAAVVDDFLPWVSAVGGMAWLAAAAAQAESADEGWLGPVRAIVAIVLFAGVVHPISFLGVVRGMAQAKVGMPSHERLRIFGAMAVPFAVGYAMWSASGNPIHMICGGLIGLLLGLAILWLLMRLRVPELLTVLSHAAVTFALGSLACIAVMLAVNYTVVGLIGATNVKHPPSHSPLGPHLAWVAPPPAPAPRNARPDTSVVKDSGYPGRPRPQLQALVKSDSPLVSAVMSPIEEEFDEIVFPSVPSNHVAVISRPSRDEDRIVLWQAGATWQPKERVRFRHEAGMRDRYILSPDGAYIVRVVTWPKLAAQVWSFTDGQVLRNIDWTGKTGRPELLGFSGPGTLLVMWSGKAACAVEQWDVASGEERTAFAKSLPSADRAGGTPVLSPDGRFLAVASKGTATTQPVAAPGSLLIFDLGAAGDQPARSIPITALDPRWPVKPTGLAISPDSAAVAMLFEQNENALLLAWQLSDGRQIAEYVYPASPVPDPSARAYGGNVLDWLTPRAWLICGQVAIDTGNRNLGAIALITANSREQVRLTAQHMLEPGVFAVVYDAPGGASQLAVIRTTMAKAPPATQP